ncbi:MAG TPA: hypothetical protein VG841_09080 [Caulobacterales bacterium]|nr:hypothetical protein [Caulobacterales bacterium]
MHLLIILAAMLFAAATPYLAIPEGRDVEVSDSAAPDPAFPDGDSSGDLLAVQDAEAGDDARDDV